MAEEKKWHENVVLIQLRVTCPSESKKDIDLTEQLCQKTGADLQSLRVRKDLFKLRAVTRHRDAARKLLREECAAWSATRVDSSGTKKQDPQWACSGRDIQHVTENLAELRESFMDAKRLMVDNYQGLLDEAKARLGTTFNPKEFPTKEEFDARFTWEVEVNTLADTEGIEEDFRVRLPTRLAEEQIALHRNKLESRMENCVAEAKARVKKLIVGTSDDPGLVPRLRKYQPDADDKRKGNSFRDKSLYQNFDELREWVDGVNAYVESDELDGLIGRMDNFTRNVRPSNPEDVRTDPATRKGVITGLLEVADASGSKSTTRATSKSGRKNKKSGAGQFV